MADEESSLELTRLRINHDLLEFDCGDDDLNEFFYEDSRLYQRDLLSVTYVMEKDNKTILFFSVSNDKISISDVKENSIWNRFRKRQKFPQRKRLSSYPAVKIGRLGVHRDFQSQNLGQHILDFIKLFFVENNKTGCRFITVDAYSKENVINFYRKNGFDFLIDDSEASTRLMVFDLAPIAQSIYDSSQSY
jgi:GNAT superfamily N-acetyltransferase